ncbi:TPA: hypothetical protein ACJ7FE_001779, partial [Streptococcus pyogenes]
MGSMPLKVIDSLLDGGLEDNSADPIKKSTLDVYYRYLLDSNLTIPYNRIAKYVYENEQSDEVNEILENKIKFIVTKFQGGSKDKDILIKNLDKIKSNYSLAQTQKKFILKNSQAAKDILRKVKPELNKLEETVEAIHQEVEDVRDTKSSIYTDFIAILGVFSAFVFVMFGGIDVARAIFDIGNDLQTLDLSRMITVSSLMLIGVLTLMYS